MPLWCVHTDRDPSPITRPRSKRLVRNCVKAFKLTRKKQTIEFHGIGIIGF